MRFSSCSFLALSCFHKVREKLRGERTHRGLHWSSRSRRKSLLLPHLAVAKKPHHEFLMVKKMEKRQRGKEEAERAGLGSGNPTIPLRKRRRRTLLRRRDLSHHQPHNSQNRVKPPPRSSIPGTASHLPAAQRQRSGQLQGLPALPHLVSASMSPVASVPSSPSSKSRHRQPSFSASLPQQREISLDLPSFVLKV